MGKISDHFREKGLNHKQVIRVLDGLEAEGFGLTPADEAAQEKGFRQVAIMDGKKFMCTLFDSVTRQVAIIRCDDLYNPKAGSLQRGPVDQKSQPKPIRLRYYRERDIS
jgi:hypothetical protein